MSGHYQSANNNLSDTKTDRVTKKGISAAAVMSSFKMTPLLWGMILLVLFARPAHAFGAGNIASISKVEGQNCQSTCPHFLLP